MRHRIIKAVRGAIDVCFCNAACRPSIVVSVLVVCAQAKVLQNWRPSLGWRNLVEIFGRTFITRHRSTDDIEKNVAVVVFAQRSAGTAAFGQIVRQHISSECCCSCCCCARDFVISLLGPQQRRRYYCGGGWCWRRLLFWLCIYRCRGFCAIVSHRSCCRRRLRWFDRRQWSFSLAFYVDFYRHIEMDTNKRLYHRRTTSKIDGWPTTIICEWSFGINSIRYFYVPIGLSHTHTQCCNRTFKIIYSVLFIQLLSTVRLIALIFYKRKIVDGNGAREDERTPSVNA